jgi:transposase
MDMNASYNKLVTKHLPTAQIVYDRFHMQSQFGRNVLGVVRLDEARRHKAREKEILVDISNDNDKETMKSLKQEAKTEKQDTANSRSCVGHCSLTQINSPTVKPSNYNLFSKINTTLLFVMP